MLLRSGAFHSNGGFVMMHRRAAVRAAMCGVFCAASALLPAWLALSPARAQEFQKLVPFLVDLPGWTADKADGMAMQMPGTSMITATRTYKRGGASLEAQVISGAAAQGQLGMIQSGMKIETDEMRMSTAPVDGFTVLRTFQTKDNSGAVTVALASNAIFNFTFSGVGDDEAFALAKRFDWKGIQAALPK
jgi:hypothetical protein